MPTVAVRLPGGLLDQDGKDRLAAGVTDADVGLCYVLTFGRRLLGQPPAVRLTA